MKSLKMYLIMVSVLGMTDTHSPFDRGQVRSDAGEELAAIATLWPYLWPNNRPDLKTRIVLAMIALVAAKVITVFVPFTYKWATDALTNPTNVALPAFFVVPVFFVVAYGVGRIIMIGLNELRNAIFAKVGQHAVRQLAYQTFVHVHSLSLRFHLQRRMGGLSRIIERGTRGIEQLVRFVILISLPTALEFVLMAAVIGWYFNWIYLVVVVSMVLLYVWFTKWATDWRIAIRKVMNDSDNDANTKAVDSLLNFETVKYFNNERLEASRFDISLARYEKAATQTWTSLSFLNFGQTLIFTAGMVICMALSSQAVVNGTQTVGDFVMINALLIQLWMPLNFIGTIYREIKQSIVDIEMMFELLDVPPEIIDKPNAALLGVTEGGIRFENVNFHYDANRPILHTVSFEVPPGKTVAIVGPSGAGKSTISRLLYRFYDVTGGRITIDGQDLRDIQQNSLRKVIGMVPQDTVLFNDTLHYNIAYGRSDASHDEIVKAASMAQISDFIDRLPDGFKTEVGERGLKLSGGEKQRVAIARTILKAPPILILDEATSALDTHTEREIQAALDQVSKDRTTVVIAHRLSTVINADDIIVLEAGRIVEKGQHEDLLKQNGLYASMWNRQREASEAEERLRLATQDDQDGFIHRTGILSPDVS